MKHIEEYRDAGSVRAAIDDVRRRCTRRWVVMDVCGGQTHGLLRHGIEDALADSLELIHGPGCPVCVTPAEVVDEATEIARDPRVILATYGDMLRVPGSEESLADRRARGGDVRTMLSPLEPLSWAERNPEREIVVLAVGFETTAPATALALLQAQKRGIANFSVLAHHVRVLPAMRCVASAPDSRVQGFLAAGHVCTVTGYADYRDFVREFRLPVIVTGFEPLDLVRGIGACVDALERREPRVLNRYERCVREDGNVEARRLIDRVFEIATIPWRGLGSVPDGGYRVLEEFAEFDARSRFAFLSTGKPAREVLCRSGEVLSGTLRPSECPLFGTACTPDSPLGAPMVSSEGACAAYFRYGRCMEIRHA